MPDSRDALQHFSATLHHLYRWAFEMPADEFRPSAMRLFRSLVGFDSGVWASGLGAAKVHSRYLFNQPLAMAEGYQHVRRDDDVIDMMLARPGVPVRCNVDSRYPVAARSKAAIRDHMLRFDVGNALMVSGTGGAVNALNWIVLWRKKIDAQYSRDDAVVLGAFWPHMSQALELNQRINLVDLYAREGARRVALAIVDRHGAIELAGPEFDAMIREEWTWWERPTMPPGVRELAMGSGPSVFQGKRIRLDVRKSADLCVVRARLLDTFDRLSERERQIATRFAKGFSYKEIARELAIAPSTVRNRLQDIYRKIGVSDKAELATLIAGRRNEGAMTPPPA